MTHDQIREMVRKANPVGDPASLEHVAAPDLTIDGEWRIDMQTDDRPTVAEPKLSKWRGPLVGIAAAVIVLIGGLVFYLATREDTPVAQPAPNATELTTAFTPIAPGAYYTDTDGAGPGTGRGTFVIDGEGWASLETGAKIEGTDPETWVALIISRVDEVASPGCDDTEWVTAGGTAEELANQFATLHGFLIREGVAPVAAFGQEGYHMLVELPGFADTSYERCEDGEFNGWKGGIWQDRHYQVPGQMLEFWFLDVDGTPILVEATTFPSSPEEDVAELEAVLDTLVITP